MKLTENEKRYLFELEQKITENNPYAMEEWATFYAYNRPDLIDESITDKIIKYYEIAIDVGSTQAALNLGAVYYSGVIVKQNFKKAIELYKIAAASDNEQISTTALCNLGYCYYYGRDIPVDYEEAFNCFLQGALSWNDCNCYYKLGDMYRYGNFVKQSEAMAFKLYKEANDCCGNANEVYPDILKRLGECYLFGIGTEKDATKAIQYLTEAQGYLYQKIYVKMDPFAGSVLDKVNELVETAKREIIKDGVK